MSPVFFILLKHLCAPSFTSSLPSPIPPQLHLKNDLLISRPDSTLGREGPGPSAGPGLLDVVEANGAAHGDGRAGREQGEEPAPADLRLKDRAEEDVS